jgi:hypothetical protein
MAKEKKTRNELDILEEKRVAVEEYAELAKDPNRLVSAVEELSGKIKMLGRELDDYLTAEAKPCPNCGNKPMGMLKTPAYTDRGVDYPNIWEIGCVFCPPFLVETDGGRRLKINGLVTPVKRRSYSARGFSVGEVTEKWNNDKYVEDFLFERIPNFTPEYVNE